MNCLILSLLFALSMGMQRAPVWKEPDLFEYVKASNAPPQYQRSLCWIEPMLVQCLRANPSSIELMLIQYLNARLMILANPSSRMKMEFPAHVSAKTLARWLVPFSKYYQRAIEQPNGIERESKRERTPMEMEFHKLSALLDKAIRQCKIVKEHIDDQTAKESALSTSIPSQIWLNTLEFLEKNEYKNLSLCNKKWNGFCEKNGKELMERYNKIQPLKLKLVFKNCDSRGFRISPESPRFSLSADKKTLVTNYAGRGTLWWFRPFSIPIQQFSFLPVSFRIENREFFLDKFDFVSEWWRGSKTVNLYYKTIDYGSQMFVMTQYDCHVREDVFVDGNRADQINIPRTPSQVRVYSPDLKIWVSKDPAETMYDKKFDQNYVLSLLNE